jgi:glycosyltransferase involved in cell wall biosynthesis
MAHPNFAFSRHIGLLAARAPEGASSSEGEAGLQETRARLESSGLRLRLYAVDAVADDANPVAGVAASQHPLHAVFESGWSRVRPHLHRLAKAPLRYLGVLGQAALRGRAGLAEFAAAVRLANAVYQDRIAHLHACDPASASLAELVARITGLRFSVTMAAPAFNAADLRCIERSLTAAQFTLMPTEAALRAATAIAPRAAVHRACPGVDTRRHGPKLRRPASLPLLLAVGEPRAEWDLLPLIEACRMLTRGGVALRCEVVGAARDLPRMQAHIDRCGLRDRVRLLGPLSASRLIERYGRAAVFVQIPCVAAHVSVGAIPSGLLEAMAMGLPVIATRTPVNEECIAHASNGWLAPSGDAQRLFEAIQRLLEQPRLGERLGNRARETIVERFDGDAYLQTLQRLLEQASQRVLPARARAFGDLTDPRPDRRAGFAWAGSAQRRATRKLHHA